MTLLKHSEPPTIPDRLKRRWISIAFAGIGLSASIAFKLAAIGLPFSVIAGVLITIVGILFDISLLLDTHHDSATKHYGRAQERYNALERLDGLVATRVLHDVDALVTDIERDIAVIIAAGAGHSKGLFTRLLQVDLKALQKRLLRVKNENALPLDTHEHHSHIVVCKAIEEEGIEEFRATYDLRHEAVVKLHALDKAFAVELHRLVATGKVKCVVGLFIIADTDFATWSEGALWSRLGELSAYFPKTPYAAYVIGGSVFDQHCSTLKIIAAREYPDIGIYGSRYVYQAIPPDPENGIPRGAFYRAADTISSYRELFERCVKEAKHAVNSEPSPISTHP